MKNYNPIRLMYDTDEYFSISLYDKEYPLNNSKEKAKFFFKIDAIFEELNRKINELEKILCIIREAAKQD